MYDGDGTAVFQSLGTLCDSSAPRYPSYCLQYGYSSNNHVVAEVLASIQQCVSQPFICCLIIHTVSMGQRLVQVIKAGESADENSRVCHGPF